MKLSPFLLLNGVEIANGHRSLTYIRAGLAGTGFEICADAPGVGGYVDLYADIYTGDPYETSALCCYCRAFDFGNYGNPTYDNAPWVDANRPESAGFLGLLPDIVLLSVASRTLTTRAAGRGDIGPLTANPRIVQVTSWMVADSPAAMEYGERWLSRMLAGGGAGCGGDTLTLLPACPPDEVTDASTYLRELARVGIIDGPEFRPLDNSIPECILQEVTWQWAAGEPWLRKSTELASIDLASDSVTCTAIEAPVVADAAVVVTIQAGPSPLDGVLIEARSGGCPGAGTAPIAMTVDAIPALSRLVIDASLETVVLYNVAGNPIGGPDALDFTGIMRWAKAAAGTNMSVRIDASGATGTAGATATVTQVDLEW